MSVRSTTLPRYMTATSSHISATTPRSWVMKMMLIPRSCLQLGHQFQNLRLGGHVEGRGRLVGDQQAGVAAQGNGDHDPLSHAAAELVGIAVKDASGFRQLHLGQGIDAALTCLLAVDILVQVDGFQQLVADGIERIERGHGFLKDHGDLIAADAAHSAATRMQLVISTSSVRPPPSPSD